MELKFCSKCQRNLSIENFSKNKSTKDGYEYWCKECIHEQYKKHKQKRSEWQKAYRERNKEKISQKAAEYRQKNKSKKSEYDRKRYQENKYEIIKQKREYFLNNKERVYENNKKYRENHKQEITEYKNVYRKEREKIDDLYKFKRKIRHLIYLSFARKDFRKENHVTEILGCTEEEAQKHLYKTFYDNYGYEYDGQEDVHIDHIIPLKTAETEEDVKRLCHYTNLQLLKPIDNMKKGAKMPLLTK